MKAKEISILKMYRKYSENRELLSDWTKSWIERYKDIVVDEFGDRVKFVGIQGSRARNEARETSDIDVVMILDKMEFEDLVRYENCVKNIENRDLLCGFVSGYDEINNWNKCELFQFCMDTVSIYGNLDEIIEKVTVDDINKSVRDSACMIYHSAAHNYLHAKDIEMLKGLYKMAFFTIQAKLFLDEGIYLRRKSNFEEVRDVCSNYEKNIMDISIGKVDIDKNNFGEKSKLLIDFAREIINSIE